MSITPTLNVAANAVIPSGETDVPSAGDFTTGDEITADSGVSAASVSILSEEEDEEDEEDAALERGRMEILGFN